MRILGRLTAAAIAVIGAADAAPTGSRYAAGMEQLQRIDGPAGTKVVEQLDAISPDLSRLIVEHVFGDVYTRPGLSIKDKELAVVAALTAMGTAEPQLKVHIAAALHVGNTPVEIAEVILQMSVYAGFPASLNAMMALKQTLCEEGVCALNDTVPPPADRHATGAALLAKLDAGQLNRLNETFAQLSPDLPRLIVGFGFGEVLSRPGLSLKQRELITIAALAAKGTAPSQLRFHIKGGLATGLSEGDVREVMILMSVYAGFPAAINGTVALRDVLAERTRGNKQ